MQVRTFAQTRAFAAALASKDGHGTRTALRRALLARFARPLRFAAVGVGCSLVQLTLLLCFRSLGIAALPANVAAYLLSAQLNFVLSNRFIWHDRWSSHHSVHHLLRRWIAFHVSIAGTFVVNQILFIAARAVMADLPASALAIAITGVLNFVI